MEVKKTVVVRMIVNGQEVKGKRCTSCEILKPLDDFPRNSTGVGGRHSHCKACRKKREKKANALPKSLVSKTIHGKVVIGKVCTACHKWKPTQQFYPKSDRPCGIESRCILCERKRNRSRKSYHIAYKRQYYKEKTDQVLAYKHKRKAMKRYLPHSISAKDYQSLRKTFGNACALTGVPLTSNTRHYDHPIPLSWGHGGSYIGNLIPLHKNINLSKHNKNLFTWFHENKDQLHLSETLFRRLIQYLASLHNMTPKEYEEYVFWCEQNKRTPEEVKKDPRHSYEIFWDEKHRKKRAA